MTAVLIAGLGVATIVDWVAVWQRWTRVEEVLKPLVMVVLLGLAMTSLDGSVRIIVCAAIVFGMGGDIALLKRVDMFIVGLASFLVGHILYVVAFATDGLNMVALAAGTVFAAVLIGGLGKPIIEANRGSALRAPVTAYIVVIACMVAAAIGTTRPVVAAGAVLFALSDALLGYDRFVTPRSDRRIAVMVMYHLGQFAIVAGLV
ncbi:MAG: lysoplasmalogenase [Actinomycetia bacterium]|nr:lysoplasmalogenase [Actinomycetes bacterium]MCP4958104.1 lysoplasmalogenase [Actinomycetes bacterium]